MIIHRYPYLSSPRLQALVQVWPAREYPGWPWTPDGNVCRNPISLPPALARLYWLLQRTPLSEVWPHPCDGSITSFYRGGMLDVVEPIAARREVDRHLNLRYRLAVTGVLWIEPGGGLQLDDTFFPAVPGSMLLWDQKSGPWMHFKPQTQAALINWWQPVRQAYNPPQRLLPVYRETP